jgi:hypothetical protein
MVLKVKQENLVLKIESRSKKEAFRKLLRVSNDLINKVDYGFEVAICKDILSDGWDIEVALPTIIDSGYTEEEATIILAAVIELTDFYTKKDYPKANRAERKEMERGRIAKTSFLASCVKLSDYYYSLLDCSLKQSSFKKILSSEIWEVVKGMEHVEDFYYLRLCSLIYQVKTNDIVSTN